MILVLLQFMLIYRVNNVHCISTNLNVPVLLYLALPCVSIVLRFIGDISVLILAHMKRAFFFNNISKFDLFDAQTIRVAPCFPTKAITIKWFFIIKHSMSIVRKRSHMGVGRAERNSSKQIIRRLHSNVVWMLWMLRRKHYDDQ